MAQRQKDSASLQPSGYGGEQGLLILLLLSLFPVPLFLCLCLRLVVVPGAAFSLGYTPKCIQQQGCLGSGMGEKKLPSFPSNCPYLPTSLTNFLYPFPAHHPTCLLVQQAMTANRESRVESGVLGHT